ncbi:hypothetical protein QE381_001357 [Microbacterium sp. SORGH_AS 888]|nr:hypothetical protein [Microbacterium sp. SORGH_AS_0888]
MSAGRTLVREPKITTIARTKPPRPPMIHGAMEGVPPVRVTVDIDHSQPATAPTRRIANRPIVL